MSDRPSWQKSWLPLSDAELWHFYRMPDRATILRHVAAWRYPRDAGRQSLFIAWHRECCPEVIPGFALTDQTLEFLGRSVEGLGEFWLTEEEGERLNTIAGVAWFDRLAHRLARWAPHYTPDGQRVDHPGNDFDPLTGAVIGEFHPGGFSDRDETRWRWSYKLAPRLLGLVERGRALLGTENWPAARAVHLEAALLRRDEKDRDRPRGRVPGRVLRTNTDVADWLIRRLEWPRRLARYEAVARMILEQHPDPHPRRKVARGILSLIMAAKTAGERGEPVDLLMVTIEHQVRLANENHLKALAKQALKDRAPRRDRITRTIELLGREQPKARPRELWPALANRLGGQIKSYRPRNLADEELLDAKGHLLLTFPEFEKRLYRMRKNSRPGSG